MKPLATRGVWDTHLLYLHSLRFCQTRVHLFAVMLPKCLGNSSTHHLSLCS